MGLETVTYTVLIGSFLIGKLTPTGYVIIEALLFASITRNIICGTNRLKAMRYNEQSREEYDNKDIMLSNVSSLLGFGFSTLITLSLTVCMILMLIGTVVDNVFYYYVWKTTTKQYK